MAYFVKRGHQLVYELPRQGMEGSLRMKKKSIYVFEETSLAGVETLKRIESVPPFQTTGKAQRWIELNQGPGKFYRVAMITSDRFEIQEKVQRRLVVCDEGKTATATE